MMTINDIKNYSFHPQRGGNYKAAEVDSFFSEVLGTLDALTSAYEKAKKDNDELYKKISVLSNRIDEYRRDEDSIRTTLITAQRMADTVLKEANDKAKQIVDEATNAADEKIGSIKGETDDYVKENRVLADKYLVKAKEEYTQAINNANQKSKEMLDNATSEAEKLIADARKMAKEITDTANSKSDDIVSEAEQRLSAAKDNLAMVNKLTYNFKNSVIEVMKKQIDLLNSIEIDESEIDEKLPFEAPKIDEDSIYDPKFSPDEYSVTEVEITDEIDDASNEGSAHGESDDTSNEEDMSETVDIDIISDDDIEEIDIEQDVASSSQPEEKISNEDQFHLDSEYFDNLMKSFESHKDEDEAKEKQKTEKSDKGVFGDLPVTKQVGRVSLKDDIGKDEELHFGVDYDIFGEDDEEDDGETQTSFFGRFKRK